MSSQPLPSNVHVSSHPCLHAKLSQLRSSTTNSRDTNRLVHEIALIVGCEALAGAVGLRNEGKDKTPLGYEYATKSLSPSSIAIIPILRSGLGMVEGTNSAAATLAILLDPVIATGGTSEAAIQTLREWGVQRVLVISVLGSEPGLRRAAEEWAEGTELWVGAVDQEVDKRGMIKPGIGDVGDRLFLTLGK
ncbi:MAG: hypothetical protein M1813_009096 [Trichoglossum hirsutum]|nr:MAG: hypothetical protein M1813_009096 [Trichoglossum hirsutum]